MRERQPVRSTRGLPLKPERDMELMRATWKYGFMALALLAVGVAAHGAQDPAVKPAAGEIKATKPAPERLGDVYASSTKGPMYYHNEYELRVRKLTRGVLNVVLSPAEIPNQMFREAYQSSPGSGMFIGFFKGIGKGAKRVAIGTWEMATFYFPGNNHYQPFVEPEVVFMEYVH